MAIPLQDDDVEFEAENIRNLNDLKEDEIHIFLHKHAALLFPLHLQVIQGKISAASN